MGQLRYRGRGILISEELIRLSRPATSARRFDKRADTQVARAVLSVVVCAALAACAENGGRLSLAEGLKCATEEFSGHAGTFSLGENAIAYSYESPNGSARVLVVFDAARRPVRTLFESAPHGSHPVLMDAARVIRDCVAYGPKRGESDKGGATSMIGK